MNIHPVVTPEFLVFVIVLIALSLWANAIQIKRGKQ